MSLEEPATSPAATITEAAVDSKGQPQPSLRSWRKKYRKLKLRFAKVMDESSNFFKDEHKALALARRLQEENDQLLDMLLDLNESGHVPERYDLALPDDNDNDFELAPAKTSAVTDSVEVKHLSALLDIPHTIYTPDTLPNDLAGDNPTGYFDAAYEEEYLNNLDSQISDPAVLSDTNKPLRIPPSRTLPSDKDLAHQNSDSVLSWLRRHHPETFIQEKDHPAERPAPRQRGGGKRSSLANTSTPNQKPDPKPDPDSMDEDTHEGERSTGRGRRNKDDEPYRPKGGSSRGSKRKRDDGAEKPTTGRAKKQKASASVAQS